MYMINRKVNGQTEILKDSNSTSNKVFHDYDTAKTFAQKLNSRTHSNKQWSVTKIQNIPNAFKKYNEAYN